MWNPKNNESILFFSHKVHIKFLHWIWHLSYWKLNPKFVPCKLNVHKKSLNMDFAFVQHRNGCDVLYAKEACLSHKFIKHLFGPTNSMIKLISSNGIPLTHEILFHLWKKIPWCSHSCICIWFNWWKCIPPILRTCIMGATFNHGDS